MCWYCHWGWSKAVADIYDRFEPIAGEWAMKFGSAHIVWEDENFDRHNVQWCLDNFDKYLHHDDDLTPEQNAAQNEAVRQSLIALLELPDEQLDPEPEDYDGENPENYPPAVEMSRGGR